MWETHQILCICRDSKVEVKKAGASSDNVLWANMLCASHILNYPIPDRGLVWRSQPREGCSNQGGTLHSGTFSLWDPSY